MATTPSPDGTRPAYPAKPDWAMSPAEARRARHSGDGQPPTRRRWPWLVLLLLIAVGAGGYLYLTRYGPAARAPDTAATGDAPQAVMQVNTSEVTTLEPRTLQRMVRVIGTLDPIRQAQLSAQVSGQIEDVRVRAGDPVAQDNVLVQVDVETLSLELKQARSNAEASRAQLRLAEAQLERVQQLSQRGVTATSNVDEAESNVNQLRASVSALEDQIAGAELRLRNATVRAPYDGLISDRAVEPGQYVSVGTPLVTVVDLTSVELQGNAPVASGALLHPGQAVSVDVDGIAGRSFAGTVARINPVAREGTRTIPVYVTLDNPDGILRGGMFATGQIVVEEARDAIAVPTAALRQDAAGVHLLGIDAGHLVRRPVEVAGNWAGGLTRIVSGAVPGETVVTAPLPVLMAGDPIEIVAD